MNTFTFNTVPGIRFGAGLAHDIGAMGAGLLGKRIMVVTDPGMIATGLVERVVTSLAASGAAVELFSEVAADPPEAVVLAGADAARNFGATGIVGFGGGSSLDVAKLIAVLAKGSENLGDLYGIGNIKGGRLPLMAVPTTAGTGSEVTPIAIVTTGKSEKMGVVSPVILPDIALLDPELTVGLPASVTAATGIDAMVHAIEAYASKNANNNPLSRHLAREAMRLMGAAVETAVREPDNLAARSDMLLGSMLAGQAFANSPVAAVHALAYPIGGHYKVPHGLSNALVLPHVLRFNAETHPEPYAEIGPCAFPELGLLSADNGGRERAFGFAEAMADLARRCGLPQNLRDVGIGNNAIALLARDAMNQTRLLVNNPRDVTEADARAIYTAAW
ncbi:MAG: iron-containing alcohol dehydrogenase [Rhizobiales bacterium]|nr:iron-containing alcohol dehydrogenase [Hyphomicrobiales bacterium]